MVIELNDGEPEDRRSTLRRNDPVDGDGDAVYFTSDALYKIDLPIVVAEWCWDSKEAVCYYDEDEGEAEDEDYMPLITYAGPADASGDATAGFVCGSLTFEEAGLALEPFDCTVNFHPVQVMKTDDEDYYSVMQLDPSTGEYEEVYDLEHLITEDGHINAVDLWLMATSGAYAGCLCELMTMRTASCAF